MASAVSSEHYISGAGPLCAVSSGGHACFQSLTGSEDSRVEVVRKRRRLWARSAPQIFLVPGHFLLCRSPFVFIVFVVSYGTDPEGRYEPLRYAVSGTGFVVGANRVKFRGYPDRNGRIGVYKLVLS